MGAGSAPASAANKPKAKGRLWLCAHLTSEAASQVKRGKLGYCLGVLSVLFIVVVAAVVQTLLSKAPLVFTREAEAAEGQLDVRLLPAYSTSRRALNYTLMHELALAADGGGDKYSYSSPRLKLYGRGMRLSACMDVPAGFDLAADNAWMYTTAYYPYESAASGVRCDGPDADRFVTVTLSDTTRERRMGQGRAYPFEKLPPGHAVLRSDNAESLGVSVGDIVLVRVYSQVLVRHLFAPPAAGLQAGQEPPGWPELATTHSTIMLPVKIAGVVPSWDGKFNEDASDTLVVEYDTFVQYAAPRLHPRVRADAADPTVEGSLRASTDGDAYHYASEVGFNFPPDVRLDQYTDGSYDVVQANVISFSTVLLYALAFTDVGVEMPMLVDLEEKRFVTLYLSLLLSILLVVLSALSTLLVYSLLMINVQARTFELAVRRTLGASRRVVGAMLFVQAMSFAIPAWVVGLVLARVLSIAVLNAFDKASGIPVTAELSGAAVLLATFMAFVTPSVASVGPIRSALSSSLRDALDVDRPKTSAVKFKIERAEDAGVNWSLVSFGGALALFGAMVYYGIPLALLTVNLTLFINIFLWILIAMLFGMVLLAINIELSLARVVAFGLLFWEKAVVTKLAITNLIAHRQRNRKTMIMFALSVSFIVFLSVASNQQIRGAIMWQRRTLGSPLGVNFPSAASDPATLLRLQAALASPDIEPLVQSHSLVTHRYRRQRPETTREQAKNVGLLYDAGLWLYSVPPNLFSALYPDYVLYGERSASGLPLGEQPYTAAGSQSIVTSNSYEYNIFSGKGDDMVVQTTQDSDGDLPIIARTRLNIMTTMYSASWFDFSQYPSDVNLDAFVSIPTLLRMSHERGLNTTVENLHIRKLFVFPQPGLSDEQFEKLRVALVVAIRDAEVCCYTIDDIRDFESNLSTTVTLLNFFFSILTVVAMFLCFFSLLSSMVANITEQTKEIGVLRALGLPPSQLVRVYVHEAFILVVSASLMGVVIGTAVAWTFDKQRALFTGLPLAIIIPYNIIITTLIVAVLSSMLASCAPARRLMRQNITKLLRHV